MKPHSWLKRLAGLALLLILILALATPAQAFTPRGGEQVIIAAGEVVDDDLYATASTVVVRGTIQGDLVALGSAVIIEDTGIVTGDLLAAGQGVVIRGRVGDTARIAGAVLSIGPQAVVGGDLVAAGYNLDVQKGGQVTRDLVAIASGVFLGGQVGRNARVQSEGLTLAGAVDGDLSVSVSQSSETPPFNLMAFFPAQAALPAPTVVMGGLHIDPGARVGGGLVYTAPQEVSIPAGVVRGPLAYAPPPPEPTSPPTPPEPTQSEKLLDWLTDLLRSLATLLLIGLLLSYTLPNLLRRSADMLQQRPFLSLGWGVLTYVGLFFLLSLVIAAAVILSIALGMMTLNDLLWTTLGVGSMAFMTLTVVFKIAASYLSKIVVGYVLGRLLLSRLGPRMTNNRVWPPAIGIILFVLLTQIPVIGGILNFIGILLGLGALFLLARQLYEQYVRPAVLEAA